MEKFFGGTRGLIQQSIQFGPAIITMGNSLRNCAATQRARQCNRATFDVGQRNWCQISDHSKAADLGCISCRAVLSGDLYV